MTVVVYLNRWGHVFHAILAVSDGEIDYTLSSRVCGTLDAARLVVRQWQQNHSINPEDIRDNSEIDLGVLLAGIELADFSPANN